MPRRVINSLRCTWRGVRVVLHLVKLVCMVALIWPYMRLAQRDRVISRWSYGLLRILQVHIHLHGDIPPPHVTSVLFIANHISWLDIIALDAFRRMRFVAKAEVRQWPVIGWLAAQTGTFFLQRSNQRQMAHLTSMIANALCQKHCVALFPEGTTTDGTSLKSFYPGLFEAARRSTGMVWPVAIRYAHADGSLHLAPAFLGEQSLVNSIAHVLTVRSMHLHLSFAPPLDAQEFTRRDLAHHAHAAITSLLVASYKHDGLDPQTVPHSAHIAAHSHL